VEMTQCSPPLFSCAGRGTHSDFPRAAVCALAFLDRSVASSVMADRVVLFLPAVSRGSSRGSFSPTAPLPVARPEVNPRLSLVLSGAEFYYRGAVVFCGGHSPGPLRI